MLLIMIHLYSASSKGICPTTFRRNFASAPNLRIFGKQQRYLRLREVRGLNIVLFNFVLEEPMGEEIMI